MTVDAQLFVASEEIQAATCEVCPAQLLSFGRFDVAKPGPDTAYNPDRGCRTNRVTGAPTCVHPFRVGLPEGRYCSDRVPLPPAGPPPGPDPSALELPEQADLLEGWLVALLRGVPQEKMASTLFRAEAIACEQFPGRVVVAAVRRVMAQLAG